MIEITRHFAGEGYLITTGTVNEGGHQVPDGDTTNIVCLRGHIYADGDSLVAALDGGTRAECMALRKLGTPIMDGDFGELSVRFPLPRFRDVARILKPRQAALAKVA